MIDKILTERRIRLFVSSTFKDMEAERDYLANQVFPQLRAICARRNVEFVELDLRWGITEEASKNGKVAEICLSEIERTRPFFIGLLGDRYGWIPTEEEAVKNPALRQRFGWIDDDIAGRRSITEIEMQFGVLRYPATINAFFYLREENPEGRDTTQQTEGKEAERKLAQLKKQIREQERYPVSEYASPEALGERIIADFTAVLDRLFPEETLSETELLRIDQQTFEQKLRAMYVPRNELYARLDDWAEGAGRCLLITGAVGVGKSALIANWCARRADLNTVPYSWQSSPKIGQMLRIPLFFSEEIFRRFEIPNREIANADQFKELVAEVKDRMILLVDGADAIRTSTLNDFMELFDGVKIVFALPDSHQAISDLELHGVERMTVGTPDTECRKAMITQYLGYYAKALPEEMVEQIVADEKFANPYTLKMLLAELRVFGEHERIGQYLDQLLGTTDVSSFIDKLLDRAEKEYGDGENNYVERVFSVLALSQNGLSEHEIMEITDTPSLRWAPLYAAMETWMGYASGALYLSNRDIAQRVSKRYGAVERAGREQIAVYFAAQHPDDYIRTRRKFTEIAWQYYNLEAWERLHELLLEKDVARMLYTDELVPYWRNLEAQGYSLEAYLELDAGDYAPSLLGDLYRRVAAVCLALGKEQLMLHYNQRVIDVLRQADSGEPLDHEFRTLGIRYTEAYQFAAAEHALAHSLREALKRRKQVSEEETIDGMISESDRADDSISESYNALGMLYWYQKRYGEAVGMFENAIETLEPIADKYPYMAKRMTTKLGKFYNNLGNSYVGPEKAREAETAYLKAQEYRERNFVRDITNYEVLKTYYSLAILYGGDLKEKEKAAEYHDKIIAIYKARNCRSNIEREDMWRAYYSAAVFFDQEGPFDKAEVIALEALDISASQIESDVARYKTNNGQTHLLLGGIYRDKCQFARAVEHLLKAIAIFEQIQDVATDNLFELCRSYGRLGSQYAAMTLWDLSETYYRKTVDALGRLPISSCERYLGEHYMIMHNMAYMYSLKFAGRYEKAIRHVEKTFAGNPVCRITQARLRDKWVEKLIEEGKYRKAVPIWIESLEIAFETMLDYPSDDVREFISKGIAQFGYMIDRYLGRNTVDEQLFLWKIEYLINRVEGKTLPYLALPEGMKVKEQIEVITRMLEIQRGIYDRFGLQTADIEPIEMNIERLLGLYEPEQYHKIKARGLVTDLLRRVIQVTMMQDEENRQGLYGLIGQYITLLLQPTEELFEALEEAQESGDYSVVLAKIDILT